MPRTHRLERTQLIARPLCEVFDFFSDAGNLQAITPSYLHFQIDTPLPIEMKPGAVIEYRLRLFYFPIKWRTRIDVFEPMRRFVDRQVKGPYRLWRHEHEFLEKSEGTLMTDRVDYQLPYGAIGAAAGRLFVHRTLEQVFNYRRERIAALLEA